MNYALKPWETLVLSTISPEKLSAATAPSLRELIAQSAAERDHLRILFMEHFYAAAKQKKMAFYISFNQTVLIRLLDTLYRYQQASNHNAALAAFYESISGHVGFILDFMEDYFDKYFDRSASVPAAYLAISRQDIQRQLTILDTLFISRTELEPELCRLLLGNFSSFCTGPGCSYHELLYQKALLKELLELDRIPSDIDARALVLDMLVYMNFNHPGFIRYYLQGVATALKDLRSTPSKLERLQEAERLLRLQTEKPGMSLRPGAPSARAALLLALDKEAGYLNHRAPAPVVKTTGTPYPNKMVSVPFRGAEIYLLHKSFIDAGGAPQELYKSLLEKTAGHLGNKTQQGFSADSLVKYSDKVDPESKDTVKRFLQKMIRNIESYD